MAGARALAQAAADAAAAQEELAVVRAGLAAAEAAAAELEPARRQLAAAQGAEAAAEADARAARARAAQVEEAAGRERDELQEQVRLPFVLDDLREVALLAGQVTFRAQGEVTTLWLIPNCKSERA